MGADFIATGHYAQTSPSPLLLLTEGADKNKDQSYFLWTLGQEELKHTLFPVGHLQKSEVRELAKKFKLPTAEKKDSQGICFIGKVDMKEFLSHYIESKPGKVFNENGNRSASTMAHYFILSASAMVLTITQKSPGR
jgi:tRNA-specific 2-thiouridylase